MLTWYSKSKVFRGDRSEITRSTGAGVIHKNVEPARRSLIPFLPNQSRPRPRSGVSLESRGSPGPRLEFPVPCFVPVIFYFESSEGKRQRPTVGKFQGDLPSDAGS